MGNSSYFWTQSEIEALKNAYQNGNGLQDAVKVIPKSRGTIAAKASRLAITVPKPRSNPSVRNVQSGFGTGSDNQQSSTGFGN